MTHYAEAYEGADGGSYRIIRADKNDRTPIHVAYPNGYDSRCGACWLGYGHSEAHHETSIAQSTRA